MQAPSQHPSPGGGFPRWPAALLHRRQCLGSHRLARRSGHGRGKARLSLRLCSPWTHRPPAPRAEATDPQASTPSGGVTPLNAARQPGGDDSRRLCGSTTGEPLSEFPCLHDGSQVAGSGGGRPKLSDRPLAGSVSSAEAGPGTRGGRACGGAPSLLCPGCPSLLRIELVSGLPGTEDWLRGGVRGRRLGAVALTT